MHDFVKISTYKLTSKSFQPIAEVFWYIHVSLLLHENSLINQTKRFTEVRNIGFAWIICYIESVLCNAHQSRHCRSILVKACWLPLILRLPSLNEIKLEILPGLSLSVGELKFVGNRFLHRSWIHFWNWTD
jgi:hypothetical protein